MSRSIELRKKRHELVKKLREFHEKISDEKRNYSPEEQEEWDRRNQEIDDLKGEITREEKLETIEVETAVKEAKRHEEEHERKRKSVPSDDPLAKPTDEDWNRAFRSWALPNGIVELNDRDKLSCKRTRINPFAQDIEIRMTTTAGAGGETIPEGFVRNWKLAQDAVSGLRTAATILATASGNDLPWPTTDDTSNAASLISEGATITATDVTTGSVVFKAYKYGSLVQVSSELMQDSAFNMDAELGSILGKRLARGTNAHFTTGTGSSQPNGIVTAAATGVTAASSSAITSDEILQLLYKVDPAYRAVPGMAWMMHDAIALEVRKLKDSNNQYLWQPGYQLGQPDRLLGFPTFVNQDMASAFATNALVIIVGDLKQYIIRDAGAVRIRRLDERYADSDQVGFLALSRHDGNLLRPNTTTFNPVQVLKMAAV